MTPPSLLACVGCCRYSDGGSQIWDDKNQKCTISKIPDWGGSDLTASSWTIALTAYVWGLLRQIIGCDKNLATPSRIIGFNICLSSRTQQHMIYSCPSKVTSKKSKCEVKIYVWMFYKELNLIGPWSCRHSEIQNVKNFFNEKSPHKTLCENSFCPKRPLSNPKERITASERAI